MCALVFRSLFKKFFRETPIPLLTYERFEDFAAMLGMRLILWTALLPFSTSRAPACGHIYCLARSLTLYPLDL